MLKLVDGGHVNENRVNGGILDFVLSEGEYASEMFAVAGSPSIIQRIQMGTNVNADLGYIPSVPDMTNFWVIEIDRFEYIFISLEFKTIAYKVESG